MTIKKRDARTLILPLITAIIMLSSCNIQTTENTEAINPLLGDVSFVSKFGQQPTNTTDEDLRIKTHLEYVEYLLRQKDVSHLGIALQSKRSHLLDLLHEYWTAGIFPRNYDYPGKRVPCFIDKAGKICAVGYLIEQTAGRQTAEAINENHKYDKLLAMNDITVDRWIATSGLTKEECAMIQPEYEGTINHNTYYCHNNYISPGYGIVSSVLGGVNLSFNTINAIQISKGANSPAVGVFSLWTGAGSIILGVLNLPDEGFDRRNESQKAVSMVNIGLGTTTLVLGIWNLSTNRPKKNKSVNWNVYSFPEPDRKSGIGLRLTKRL